MPYLMVLNDGETYTTLEGCAILHIDLDWDRHNLDEHVKEAFTKGHSHGPDNLYTLTRVTTFGF